MMKISEMRNTIKRLLPYAQFEEDTNGEVIIYTNIYCPICTTEEVKKKLDTDQIFQLEN